MKKYFFFLMIACTTCGYSQKIQTYSGEFENGTANYQYYENADLERIFNGPFKYSYQNVTITGQFKNNKKDGKWKVIYEKFNHYFGGIPHEGSISIEIATGSYIDGRLEGICTFVIKDSVTKKVICKSTAHFKNNLLVGKYSYFFDEWQNHFTIEFNLNDNGFLDSTFTLKYSTDGQQIEDIRKYSDGYLFWELKRELTTGAIWERIDRTQLLNDLHTFYDPVRQVSIISFVDTGLVNELPELLSTRQMDATHVEFYKFVDRKSVVNGKSIQSRYYYFEQLPFTFVNSQLIYPGTYWDIDIGLRFWQSDKKCTYCGTTSNPFYFFTKGSDEVVFEPVKVLAIKDK